MRRLVTVLFALGISSTATAQQTHVGPFTTSAMITGIFGDRVEVARGAKDGLAPGDDVWVTSLGSPVKIHIFKTTETTAEGRTKSIRAPKLKGAFAAYVPWTCQPFPTVPSNVPGQFVDTVATSTSVVGGDLDVLIERGKPERVMPGLPVVAYDTKGGVHHSRIDWSAEPGLSSFRVAGGARLTIKRVVVAMSSCTWATPSTGTKFDLALVSTKITGVSQIGVNAHFSLGLGVVGGAVPGTAVTTKTTSGGTKTWTIASVGMVDSAVHEPGTASTISTASPAVFGPMVCPPAKLLPSGLTAANKANPPSDVVFQKGSGTVMTQAFPPYPAGSLEIRIDGGSSVGVLPGAKAHVLATPVPFDAVVDHVQTDSAYLYVPRGTFLPGTHVDGAFVPTTQCYEP